MWSVEWMRNLFGTVEGSEMDNRQIREMFRELQAAHVSQSEQSRRQFLELRALLWDIHQHEGQIIRNQEAIMTAISDFATRVKAFTDRQDAAVDNLVADVKTLNDKITELQNSGGTVSAEDQALLDEIQTHAGAIADKLDALDAQTPPAPPPA